MDCSCLCSEVEITIFFYQSESCKVKQFLEPIQGKVLKGHLIKTLFVEQEGMCQAHCFMNDICQSTNVSPQLDNGQWRCELNDAGGLENLNDEAGHVYYLTRVSDGNCNLSLFPRLSCQRSSGNEVNVYDTTTLFPAYSFLIIEIQRLGRGLFITASF